MCRYCLFYLHRHAHIHKDFSKEVKLIENEILSVQVVSREMCEMSSKTCKILDDFTEEMEHTVQNLQISKLFLSFYIPHK